jgi:hypothetical protein
MIRLLIVVHFIAAAITFALFRLWQLLRPPN